MAVIYGISVFRSKGNPINYETSAFGKNSEVFAVGDIVGYTSGDLLVQTLAAVGYAVKAQTMSSTNVTVAKVAPSYVPFDPNDVYLMGTNSDLTGNAVDAGTYYGVTGATGAQQVNVTAGVKTGVRRSVEIVEVDPFNEGGTGSGSGLRTVLVRWVNSINYNLDAEN